MDKGIIFEEVDEEKSDELEGLTIVVTGTIEGYNRKEIQDRLKNMGAKVTSQVSNSTDIVLAGKSAGLKLTKARELNIKVYENQELNEFLERLKK